MKKPIPPTMRARKPNGPMNTLEAMKKGDVIVVDRVTGNRLRSTASQRKMPFKSRTEGDKIRIWRTGK